MSNNDIIISNELHDDDNNSTIIKSHQDVNEDLDRKISVKSMVAKFNKSDVVLLANNTKINSINNGLISENGHLNKIPISKESDNKNTDDGNTELSAVSIECRKIAFEYYTKEEKQAKLCTVLTKNVFKRMEEENKQQNFCEPQELNILFHSCITAEPYALPLHYAVAQSVKERHGIWSEKPYFGDILLKFHHYYKVYKSIWENKIISNDTISELFKRPKFVACLNNFLDEEAKLENLKRGRLDLHIDEIVDFPRKHKQLLETYLKIIEKHNKDSKEMKDIKEVLSTFEAISRETNETLTKAKHFQECSRLQSMFEPFIELVNEKSTLQRQFILEGSLNKISRRNSNNLILRHLILLSDMLLICGILNNKKYTCKYQIKVADITIFENSDPQNELAFRITSPSQNNEFVAVDQREKSKWIEAFKKISVIKFDSLENRREIDMLMHIGDVAPIWVKDSAQPYCVSCSVIFTLIKRRHHCRTCGKIFCAECCNFYTYVKFDNYQKKTRVCKVCYFALEKEPQQISNTSSSSTSASSILSTQANLNNTSTSSNFIESFKDAASAKFSEIKENYFTLSRHNDSNNKRPTIDMTSNECNQISIPPVPPRLSQLQQQQLINDLKTYKQRNSVDSANTDTETDTDDEVETKVEVEKKVENELKPKFLKKTCQSDSCIGVTATKIKYNQKVNKAFEVLYADFILVSKLNKNFQNQQTQLWDRQYIQLNNNHTIEIFAHQNDKIPNALIYLNNFNMLQLTDTTIELKLKNFEDEQPARKSLPNYETSKSLDDDAGAADEDDENRTLTPDISLLEQTNTSNIERNSTRKVIKNRLSIFEFTNYQLKFLNSDSKLKFIDLINNL